MKKFMKLLQDKSGIETSELAVVIVAVVIVAFAAYQLLGNSIAAVVSDIAGKL